MFDLLPYKIYSNKKLLKSVQRPQVSLFIAFYNNIKFLELVLASLEVQTFKDFELVICDDGSKPEAVSFIHNYMKKTNMLVKHIWHEDKGFHKNQMLNKGIKNCEADYIIFIDQDCVAHPQFVREHFENKKPKNILAGRRLEFSPLISNLLTSEKIKSGFIQKNLWWFLPLLMHRKDNQGLKGIFLESPVLRKLMNRKKRGVVGCNFSVNKKDLESVNGFDMRYTGPGTGEDSDIEYRLNLNGVNTESFLHAGVQYHLYHKLQKRLNSNEDLFKVVQKDKAIVTPFGLDMIPEGEWIDL